MPNDIPPILDTKAKAFLTYYHRLTRTPFSIRNASYSECIRAHAVAYIGHISSFPEHRYNPDTYLPQEGHRPADFDFELCAYGPYNEEVKDILATFDRHPTECVDEYLAICENGYRAVTLQRYNVPPEMAEALKNIDILRRFLNKEQELYPNGDITTPIQNLSIQLMLKRTILPDAQPENVWDYARHNGYPIIFQSLPMNARAWNTLIDAGFLPHEELNKIAN